MRTTRLLLPALAAAALALTACGGDDTATVPAQPTTADQSTTTEADTPEPSSEAETSEEPEPTTEPESVTESDPSGSETDSPSETTTPAPADGMVTQYEGQPGDVIVTENFESAAGGDLFLVSGNAVMRDVGYQTSFEFTGEGPLEFQAQYVDEAIQDGSGFTIDMESPVILEVKLRGMRYPEANETVMKDVDGEDIVVDPPFEGQSTIFIGVDEEYPVSIEVHETDGGYVLNILL